jgi:hypothetical protein
MTKHLTSKDITARRWRHSESGVSDSRAHDERGAMLIMALVYLVAVSMVVLPLCGWAMNDLNNTTHFDNTRNLHFAAQSVAEVGIQSIRYNTGLTNSQAQNTPTALAPCWTPVSDTVSEETVNNIAITVWCTTTENLSSSSTRVVTVYACPSGGSSATCAADPTLTGVVTFDDYPPSGTAPLTVQCTLWCGAGSTLVSWSWA